MFSSLFFWSEKHAYQPSLSFQLFDKFLTSLNIFINAFQTGCKGNTFFSDKQMSYKKSSNNFPVMDLYLPQTGNNNRPQSPFLLYLSVYLHFSLLNSYLCV